MFNLITVELTRLWAFGQLIPQFMFEEMIMYVDNKTPIHPRKQKISIKIGILSATEHTISRFGEKLLI